MKILGLDSSGLVAGVAVVEDDVLLAEYTTDYKKTHSQTLLPMLEELRGMIELDMNTLDAIAVASGPGSFTGLRIGSATAKGLGLALKKPLVEVPTLEGLAYNLWGTSKLVCPLMDARRNQVYTAAYEFVPEGESFRLRSVISQMPEDIAEMLKKLNELGREVIFLGRGAGLSRADSEADQSALQSCAGPCEQAEGGMYRGSGRGLFCGGQNGRRRRSQTGVSEKEPG